MLPSWIIVFCSLVYIGILFAIDYYGDNGHYAKKLRPYRGVIYSLSLAIYCTPGLAFVVYAGVIQARRAGLDAPALPMIPVEMKLGV